MRHVKSVTIVNTLYKLFCVKILYYQMQYSDIKIRFPIGKFKIFKENFVRFM